MTDPMFIDDVNDLFFVVYVVGYCDRGESIVLILKEKSKNKVLYVIVIDCYQSNEYHKTIEILSDNNINEIDLLCWTHPDEDHTKGLLELIEKKCTKETVFLLPEGLYGKETDVITYSDNELEIFTKLNSFNVGQRYSVRSVSTNPKGCLEVIKQNYKDITNRSDLLLEILALAPCSPVLRRRIETQPEKIKKNDFSIALLINLGELQFLLSGDIENQTIGQISNDYIGNLCFLKTPHHTSKSSDLLLNKIDEIYDSRKVPISCTTVYKSNKLPDIDLVDEYKKRSEMFHSTGFENSKNDKFGIIEYGFCVVKKEISEPKLYGNAVEM